MSLDRLVRTVHMLNYFNLFPQDLPIFLPVREGLFHHVLGNHGYAFRNLIDTLKISSNSIILEVPSHLSSNPQLVAFIAQNYHLNGFKICITVNSHEIFESLSLNSHLDYGFLTDQPNQVVQLN